LSQQQAIDRIAAGARVFLQSLLVLWLLPCLLVAGLAVSSFAGGTDRRAEEEVK